MKKILPIVVSFFFIFNSQSQNGDTNKKIMGFKNGQSSIRNYSNVGSSQKNILASSRKTKPPIPNNLKVAGTSTFFARSMDVFGVLISESKPLQYTKGINAISFIHRKSPTYLPSSNGNSGSIVGMYSINNGASWDSTCMWANAVNLARFPQGGIYNPSGNTNINNAYLVGCGPITSGSSWVGDWYASKQITTPGTTTPGINQIAELDAAPTMKKHSFSRYSFTAISGGLVRSIANIVNDPNGVTNAPFGLRGAAMVKGQFTAGSFVWSVDSFVPCVMSRSDGSKYLNEKMIQAWDDAGINGYVVMLGVRCGVGPCLKSYQPIVYKTTTGGASWSLLPGYDFTSPSFLLSRLYPITTNSTAIIPYFSSNEGIDAVVDVNGQLHLVCTVVGALSAHNDSLDYIRSFGTEKYSYGETGPFEYPTIYDFYTKPIGGWSFHLVDSMGTEGPSGIIGQPGYPSNIWSDGSGAKMDQDARIQMSRTDDGKRLFYSWTESDSSIVGLKWNIYPDIKMKGYDVTINKVTPRFNVTTGDANTDQGAYYHFMGNKAISTGTTSFEIPFTVTKNSTLNGSLPVDHYYLNGAIIAITNFSINPCMFCGGFTSSCASLGLNAFEKNIEISSFSIIPNPSSGLVFVSFLIDKSQEIKLTITDYLGRVIESKSVNGIAGDNSIPINLSSYNSGLYLISVVSDSFTETKKIIKE